MASISTLVDRVKIQVLSSGTGSFQLGSAVPAYRGVEALIDGATYSYATDSGSLYEAGRGVYVASEGLFVRSPIISSNGGAAVGFPAGIQLIFTALASDLVASGGTLPIANALGENPSIAIAQQIVTDLIQALQSGKLNVSDLQSTLFSVFSALPDEANGGTVPAHGFYLSAGFLKVNP